MKEIDRLQCLLLARGDGIGCRGDVVPLHEALGEGLAALQHRRPPSGPKDRKLRRCSSSTSPSEAGVGPHHHQVGTFAAVTRSRSSRSFWLAGTQRANWAMPPLPGAQTTSETRRDLAMDHTNACSRPPEPITSTFIVLHLSHELVAKTTAATQAPDCEDLINHG